MYVCMYVCLNVCMNVCARACIFHVHVCLSVCLCVCLSVCMHVCICVDGWTDGCLRATIHETAHMCVYIYTHSPSRHITTCHNIISKYLICMYICLCGTVLLPVFRLWDSGLRFWPKGCCKGTCPRRTIQQMTHGPSRYFELSPCAPQEGQGLFVQTDSWPLLEACPEPCSNH